jgi:hypothetical protein
VDGEGPRKGNVDIGSDFCRLTASSSLTSLVLTSEKIGNEHTIVERSPRLLSLLLPCHPSVMAAKATVEGVASFVDAIADVPTEPPSLYMDIEGGKLAYHQTEMALLEVRFYSVVLTCTRVLDIHELKEDAFETPGTKGKPFKNLLESRDIPKVFHCVVKDQAALKGLYGVDMQNIEDTQVQETAARKIIQWGSQRIGLRDCINRYIPDDHPRRKNCYVARMVSCLPG